MKYTDQFIDRYLNNELGAEEQTAFENELKRNEELRADVEAQRLAIAGIESFGALQEKEEMRRWEKESDFSKGITYENENNSSFFYFKIAAGLALLMVLSYLIFFQSASPQGLYSKHFEAFPNYIQPIERGLEQKSITSLQKGLKYYENNEMGNAITQFEYSLSQNIEQVDVILYLGLAYQRIENHPKAIELLELAIEKDTQFLMAAKWYLSLSYLYSDNEKLLPLLKDLASKNSTYSRQAQELLTDIGG